MSSVRELLERRDRVAAVIVAASNNGDVHASIEDRDARILAEKVLIVIESEEQ